PQGNDPLPVAPQVIELDSPGLGFAPQVVWSTAGVVGLELVDGNELLVVKEAFLGSEEGTAFNHDVRLAGFGGGAVCWRCSTSSSDDANASESGVERRTPGCVFSSSRDALLPGVELNGEYAGLVCGVCLLEAAIFTVSDCNI